MSPPSPISLSKYSTRCIKPQLTSVSLNYTTARYKRYNTPPKHATRAQKMKNTLPHYLTTIHTNKITLPETKSLPPEAAQHNHQMFPHESHAPSADQHDTNYAPLLSSCPKTSRVTQYTTLFLTRDFFRVRVCLTSSTPSPDGGGY